MRLVSWLWYFWVEVSTFKHNYMFWFIKHKRLIMTLSRWSFLLPCAADIPRSCNGTAEWQSWWCWVGRMASVYVGRFLFASRVSNALPKGRSLPVRKVCSRRWGSANYLSLQQQKCRNQAVLPSRNLLLLLGLLPGGLKREWNLCAAYISKISPMSRRN